MLLGLQSTEGVAGGELGTHRCLTPADSHPAVILFGSLSCWEVEEAKGHG